ncbi:MAG: ribonuclease Z [Acidobacteriota bacterium]
MKVIPLGTSSGKPTLYRNVSAMAIVREGEWLLFDCGEATQIQVMRAGLSPNRLAAIFITHLHGDHFNGLPGFLSTMGLDRRERPLTVAGPRGLRQYLDMLARLKILYLNYPLDVKEFAPSDFRNSSSKSLLVYETPAYEVVAAPLDHRIFAIGYRAEERPRPGKFDVGRARQLGIPAGPLYGRLQSGHAIQLADGRRIESREVVGPPRPGKIVAYCTDTRPCDAAVALGRNADLLIHEATYTEELIEEAEDFGHSTAAQAARIAERASARRLLITHFSTRYPDASPLLEEARAVFADTIMARDLTEVEV